MLQMGRIRQSCKLNTWCGTTARASDAGSPGSRRKPERAKPVAILDRGTTVLPPILSTAGFPHRFTCFLKADKPCRVAVQLAAQHKEFAVGRHWMEVAMDFTPPNELMGVFPAAVTVPSDATVLISSVHFRPVLRDTTGK